MANEGSGEQVSTVVHVSPAKPTANHHQISYSRLSSVEEQHEQTSRPPLKWSIFDSGPEDHDESSDDAATHDNSKMRIKSAFPPALRPFREEAFDLEDRYPTIDGGFKPIIRPLFVYEDFPEESEIEKARNLARIAREDMEAAAAAAAAAAATKQRLPDSLGSTNTASDNVPLSSTKSMPLRSKNKPALHQNLPVLSSNSNTAGHENHFPVLSQQQQQQQRQTLISQQERNFAATPISESSTSSSSRFHHGQQQHPLQQKPLVHTSSATVKRSPDSNDQQSSSGTGSNTPADENNRLSSLSNFRRNNNTPLRSSLIEYANHRDQPRSNIDEKGSFSPCVADEHDVMLPPPHHQQHITAADVDDGDLASALPPGDDDDHHQHVHDDNDYNMNAASFDLFLPEHTLFRRAGSDEVIIEEKPIRAKFIGPYLLGAVLGEGSYAKVKEAIDSRSLQRYAVKIFCQSKLKRIPNSREQVLTEISILRSLPTHRHICSMVDLREKREKQKLYLIMELAVCGMQQLIEQLPQRRLPVWKAHAYFEQLMNAVDFIHSKSIVHKDIKPGNLVLDGHGVLKLIDFGVAQKVDPFAGDDLITTSQGSPAVQSPQVADGTDRFHGFKLDVWSCGVTLYNLITGELPFGGDTVFELFDNIVSKEHAYPNALRDDEPSLCDLIDKMLTKDELLRYSVYQISQHAWVRRNYPIPAHSPIDFQIEEHICSLLSRSIQTILPYVECYFQQRRAAAAAAAAASQSPVHNNSNNNDETEVDEDMLINALGGDSTGVDIDNCEGVKFQPEPRRHIGGAEAAVFAVMPGNYSTGKSRMLRETLPSPEVLRAVKSRDLNHSHHIHDVNAFDFFQNLPSSSRSGFTNNPSGLRFAADVERDEEEEEEAAAAAAHRHHDEETRAMQAEIEAGEIFDENDRKTSQNFISGAGASAMMMHQRPTDLSYAETHFNDHQQQNSLTNSWSSPPPPPPNEDEDEDEAKKSFAKQQHHDSATHLIRPQAGAVGGTSGGSSVRSRQGSTSSNKSSRVSAAAARHAHGQAPDQQMTWRCSPASSMRGGTRTGSVGKIHHQVHYQHSTSVDVGESKQSAQQQQQNHLKILQPSTSLMSKASSIIRGFSNRTTAHEDYDGDHEDDGGASGVGEGRRVSSAAPTAPGLHVSMQEPLLLLSPTPSVRIRKGKKVADSTARAGSTSGESGSGGRRRMKKKGCSSCAIS